MDILHTMGSDGIYTSFMELLVCYSPKSYNWYSFEYYLPVGYFENYL